MNVIILSNTKTPSYYAMLKECIDSIRLSKCVSDIFVIETNYKLHDKKIPVDAQFIFPNEPFNYNKFLNIGFGYTKDNKIIISNNDVVYEPGCLDLLNTALDTFDSVSPTSRNIQSTEPFTLGYDVEKILMGWCIGLNRYVYDKMGEFDERFSFWYQDNDYANTLKKFKLKHARVNNAYALHKYQQSHKLLENSYANTHGLEGMFKEKWDNKQ